jgi:hypothetical protein
MVVGRNEEEAIQALPPKFCFFQSYMGYLSNNFQILGKTTGCVTTSAQPPGSMGFPMLVCGDESTGPSMQVV